MKKNHGPAIYWELQGEGVPNNTIVTTWAQLQDVDYEMNIGTPEYPQYVNHRKKAGYETVECQVRVNHSMGYAFRNATAVHSYWGRNPGIENV